MSIQDCCLASKSLTVAFAKLPPEEVSMRDDFSIPSRGLRRLPATIPISLLLKREDSKTGHDAYTVDLTRKGARVRTTFVLSPGELVGIIPWGDAGKAIPSRVVWVQRSSVVGSLAGIEFLETLPA